MFPTIQICVSVQRRDDVALLATLKSLHQQTIHQHIHFSLFENTQDYSCWNNKEIEKQLQMFPVYSYYRGNGSVGADYNRFITQTKCEYICFIPVGAVLKPKAIESLYEKDTKYFISYCNIETKNKIEHWQSPLFVSTQVAQTHGGFDPTYKSLSDPFIYDFINRVLNNPIHGGKITSHNDNKDLFTFKVNSPENIEDITFDFQRNILKTKHHLFDKFILHIDGAIGDHICAIGLINKFKQQNGEDKVYVCCKSPWVYEDVIVAKNNLVDWNDPLFGGGRFNIYAYGDAHNSPTLRDAVCNMYGVEYDESLYSYPTNEIDNEAMRNRFGHNPVAVIAPSAAKIQGKKQNKEWIDTRWMEVVNHLQQLGFYVVQMYKEGDNIIPTVNEMLLNCDMKTIVATLAISEVWISLDSFIHHLASCIGKRGICLHPVNNEHTCYDENIYIEKYPKEKVNYGPKWWLDSQQPERQLSMNEITVDDVKSAINLIVHPGYLFRPLQNEYVINAKQRAMQVETEISALQHLLAEKSIESVLEIGTAGGGTIARWAEIKTVKSIISLDYPDGIHGGQGWNNAQITALNCNDECQSKGIQFTSILRDSHETETLNIITKQVNKLPTKKVDFLFIDGDHRYEEGVLRDLLMYGDLVKDGGIIAFHDIRDSEWQKNLNSRVEILWDELKQAGFTWKQFIAPVQQAIQVMPMSDPHGFGGIGVITFDKQKFDLLRAKHKYHYSFGKKNVAIITCQYNKTDLTIQCLNSIQQSLERNPNVDVRQTIVVSNGSSEEENKKLQESSVDFTFITIDKALGYSLAFNEGLRHLKQEIDYAILLNNDTQVGSNWIERLVDEMESDSKCALVGPLGKDNDEFLPGFCYLVRISALREIGCLNAGFVHGYYEDNEFCNRVRNAGYTIRSCTKNIIATDKNDNVTYDFPINHLGMGTFITIDGKEDIIKNNKEKYDYLQNQSKNLCYCLITHDLSGIEILHTLYEISPEALYLIIYSDTIPSEHILELNKLFSRKNIFATQTYGTLLEDEQKIIARNFFNVKNDNNIFYIYDRISEDKFNVCWQALFNDHSAMGVLSQNYIEHMLIADPTVKNIIGKTANTKNKRINNLLQKPHTKDIGVMFAYPYVHNNLNGFKTKIIFTGSDTDGGMTQTWEKKDDFAVNANKADILFTPSFVSKQYMEKIGVTKPIIVIPHGIDETIFTYEERILRHKHDEISLAIARDFDYEDKIAFKFLYIGEPGDRKGTFQLLEAWQKSFMNKIQYHLTIQSNKDMEGYWKEKLDTTLAQFTNVTFIRENVTQEKIAQLMKESHCLIYPSRADTFGMTVLEAMATGLPVIANTGLGFGDFIHSNYYYGLKTKRVPVADHPWMLGTWLETDVSDLISKMKYVKNHYDEATKKAEEASSLIRNLYKWSDVTYTLESVLQVINDNKTRKKKITVLITSLNRPEYVTGTVASLIKCHMIDPLAEYDIHILDQNSNAETKEVLRDIDYGEYMPGLTVTVHYLPFNYGQRGALNKAHDLGILTGDYILLTDHDNVFTKPLSQFCSILDKYDDCYIATGYLSREHQMNNVVIDNELGSLIIKSSCRAGHMTFRKNDLLKLLPLHLNSQFGLPHNASWNIGLDWEMTHWNKLSPGANGRGQFVYCLPYSCEHIGASSTWNNNTNILDFEVPMEDQQLFHSLHNVQLIELISPEKH